MGTLDGDDIDIQANAEDSKEDDDEEEKQEEDLDLQPDSSFEKHIKNIIEFEEMDFVYKGEDINTIGQIAALSKNK